MKIKTLTGTRRFGIGAVAAITVGMVTGGPAAAMSPIGSASSPAPAAVPAQTFSPLAGSASVANNTLTINGTPGADRIAVGLGTDPNTLVVDLGNGSTQTFDRTTFNAIGVFLGSGDDQFTAQPGFADEALTVDAGSGNDVVTGTDGNDLLIGGSGNDTINGGKGDDTIVARSGDDAVDGGVGHDTAFLGSGDDTFRWDAGDGSDVIDGGSGVDTLLFNGAAAAENMSLSANGPRSVFLRDVGTIRMDMNDVERLDLHPLGGADTVTVNDMTGTGFQQANVDLSAPTGGGDGAADTVTVNGTDNADRIKVRNDEGRVDAEGLTTETRISGSETTDHLQVNSLGGNDNVNVDPGVSAIQVGVDLGSGQH